MWAIATCGLGIGGGSSGTRLGPHEIPLRSAPVGWMRCIALATRI